MLIWSECPKCQTFLKPKYRNSYASELGPDTLRHALASGDAPPTFVAHLAHLLGEAPLPVIVMAVEEAAMREHVPPRTVWRNVGKLAKSLSVHRQGLWA